MEDINKAQSLPLKKIMQIIRKCKKLTISETSGLQSGRRNTPAVTMTTTRKEK